MTICQENLTDAMLDIARLLARILDTNCLDAGVAEDIDPATPGLQPECAIADLRFGVETPLPRCGMTAATTPERDVLPCWWVGDEPKCPTERSFNVERAEDAPAGTKLSIRCVVAEE